MDEAVGWLDEGESRVWRGFLAMRREIDRGIDRQLTRESGLSVADYQLLVPLSECPTGTLRARELGRGIGWERSRLSHQMRRMEQRGLIERRNCPTDARGTIIVLTTAGRAAIEAAAPAHVAWVREHFLELMSEEELRVMGDVANRIADHLRPENEECSQGDAPAGAGSVDGAVCSRSSSQLDRPAS